jgi:type II secretory pathway component GspD/PulD (secretin)
VTMEFRPGLATAEFFTEILHATRVIATGNATIFSTNFVAYPIELPNVLVKEVATSIQVPDQGSLLVGGFGHAIDQDTAERIPFLGNIPFAGRLFGKRGRYSDRSKLYLLATVNIISYDELEARL